MKNIFKALLISSLLLVTQSVFAEQLGNSKACDKYDSSYDRTYCMSKLFVESDKELNIVYKQLRDTLKGETRMQLKNIQRDWIEYRNQKCETKPGTIDVNCSYGANKNRGEYLRDRLRECKTSNCRKDMIGKKSWE